VRRGLAIGRGGGALQGQGGADAESRGPQGGAAVEHSKGDHQRAAQPGGLAQGVPGALRYDKKLVQRMCERNF